MARIDTELGVGCTGFLLAGAVAFVAFMAGLFGMVRAPWSPAQTLAGLGLGGLAAAVLWATVTHKRRDSGIPYQETVAARGFAVLIAAVLCGAWLAAECASTPQPPPPARQRAR